MRRTAAAAFLLLLAVFSSAPSDASLSNLAFERLSFQTDVDQLDDSNIGRVRFSYVPDPTHQFLNVLARVPGVPPGAWVVRNMYLPSTSQSPPNPDLGVRFPLEAIGVTVGTPLAALEYDFLVSPVPLLDSEAAAWLGSVVWQAPSAVGQALTDADGGVESPGTPMSAGISTDWFPPYLVQGQVAAAAWIGCNMPNIDLNDSTRVNDLNGCVPAACANSLSWLETQHPEIQIPPNLRDTFEQLTNLMKRAGPNGVPIDDMVRAKLDFIEAYDLPIRVDYQSRYVEGEIRSTSGSTVAHCHDADADDLPTRSWLESEVANGEDVEISGDYYYYLPFLQNWYTAGAHQAVVVGMGSTNGVPHVSVKHDTDQEHAGGTIEEKSDIIEAQEGDGMTLPGLSGWVHPFNDPVNWVQAQFFVSDVVGESYDPKVLPVPDYYFFLKYCEDEYRTLAPGEKLEIEFPDASQGRCYNVTIWEFDRTVEPPVWRKVTVWNYSDSDSSRVYVNPYPYPITIAMHNDDDHRYPNGDPSPWGGSWEDLAAGPQDTTTPSNVHAYGGFSVGWTDSLSKEFGSPPGPGVSVDASIGLSLGEIPARMNGAGVSQLTLNHPIPQWNLHWARLELRLEVAEVHAAGGLDVNCPTSGAQGVLNIDQPGTYSMDLGAVPVSPSFSITLTALPGLDFEVDAIGIPSIDEATTSVPLALAPAAGGIWNIGANPTRRETRLRFALPRRGRVDLAVFDITGARVADIASGIMDPGTFVRSWDGMHRSGGPAANGLYFIRLASDSGTWTTRSVVVR